MAQGEDGAGCELLISSGLMAENAGLVAWPYFAQLQGRGFSPKVPRESPEPCAVDTLSCSGQTLSE